MLLLTRAWKCEQLCWIARGFLLSSICFDFFPPPLVVFLFRKRFSSKGDEQTQSACCRIPISPKGIPSCCLEQNQRQKQQRCRSWSRFSMLKPTPCQHPRLGTKAEPRQGDLGAPSHRVPDRPRSALRAPWISPRPITPQEERPRSAQKLKWVLCRSSLPLLWATPGWGHCSFPNAAFGPNLDLNPAPPPPPCPQPGTPAAPGATKGLLPKTLPLQKAPSQAPGPVQTHFRH